LASALGALGKRFPVESLTVTTGPLYDRTNFDFSQLVWIDTSLNQIIDKLKFQLKTGLALGDFSHVSCQVGITRCRT
jgi:hypothetical protein